MLSAQALQLKLLVVVVPAVQAVWRSERPGRCVQHLLSTQRPLQPTCRVLLPLMAASTDQKRLKVPPRPL